MTELRLDEVIVDAVIAKLQNGWAARAALINTEKNDDIQIVAPDVGFYFAGRMQELAGTPAVFVLPGKGQFKETGAHSMQSVYPIYVHLVDQDETGPRLARRLMRQERAVIEVIYDDDPKEALYVAGQSVVKSAFRIFPQETIPGPVFQPSGNAGWRGTYVVVFRAEQEEM